MTTGNIATTDNRGKRENNRKEGNSMPINKDELTKEMIEKAMQCKTAEELIALAKTGGYELTKEEAESYLAELADIELDGETSGGTGRHRAGRGDPEEGIRRR